MAAAFNIMTEEVFRAQRDSRIFQIENAASEAAVGAQTTTKEAARFDCSSGWRQSSVVVDFCCTLY